MPRPHDAVVSAQVLDRPLHFTFARRFGLQRFGSSSEVTRSELSLSRSTQMLSPPGRRILTANCAAAGSATSNFVSCSKIRMTPMSCFVIFPLRQSIGNSHFGSAFFVRPILSRNHAAPPKMPPRGAFGPLDCKLCDPRVSRRSGPFPGSMTSSSAGRRDR